MSTNSLFVLFAFNNTDNPYLLSEFNWKVNNQI